VVPGDALKSFREHLGNKYVAAALAALAALAVGYRVMQFHGGAGVSADPPVPAEVVPTARGPAAHALAPGIEGSPQLPSPEPIPAGWAGPAWNWDRNPFLLPRAERPPDAPGLGTLEEADAGPGVPQLRGTVVGRGAGAAIFRGGRQEGKDVLVPVGERIGGWTLAEVEPYRVTLRKGKETRVLELYRQ